MLIPLFTRTFLSSSLIVVAYLSFWYPLSVFSCYEEPHYCLFFSFRLISSFFNCKISDIRTLAVFVWHKNALAAEIICYQILQYFAVLKIPHEYYWTGNAKMFKYPERRQNCSLRWIETKYFPARLYTHFVCNVRFRRFRKEQKKRYE